MRVARVFFDVKSIDVGPHIANGVNFWQFHLVEMTLGVWFAGVAHFLTMAMVELEDIGQNDMAVDSCSFCTRQRRSRRLSFHHDGGFELRVILGCQSMSFISARHPDFTIEGGRRH
jgi:hypothetical protein